MISDRGSRDRDLLKKLWLDTEGKAWEPKDTRHPFFNRMIDAGYLKRANGRFFFEAFKDSHVDWADAGKAAMTAMVGRLPEAKGQDRQ